MANRIEHPASSRDPVEFKRRRDRPLFADVDTFKKSVDAIFALFRDSDPFLGGDPVRIPGQERGSIRREREENGIPFHPNLVKALEEIATELKIPALASN